ncbi:SDR family NAD(P)-dependent oxidoreductase [Sphingomonas sp.]|uniref:SDR family NAD(P)-dependent oxidoreductase n=1 Tax=Sphingomonas sp. TaxID=28214 RepID=UPI002FC9A47F
MSDASGRFDLKSRTALVTGASSGLGVHFARVLARAGAEVVIGARRVEALERLVGEIEAEGGTARAIALDVSDTASVAAAEAQLDRLDILVNNAGIVREASAFDQSEEDWDAVIDTNLKGAFLVAQMAGRLMRAAEKGGSIINIASVLGLRQTSGVLPYAVSKAGVVQLTQTLALEWARYGIRVNAIAPGYFKTELNAHFWETDAGAAAIKRIPQRRIGRYEDLDGPLLLLASDASLYMTGAIVSVDGGHVVNSL